MLNSILIYFNPTVWSIWIGVKPMGSMTCILILHFSISLESRKWKKKLIYSSSFCLFVRYYNFFLLFLLPFVIFKWNMSKFLKNEIYFYVFSFSYFQVELPRMTTNSRDKALMMLIYFCIFSVKKVYAFLTIFKI